MEVRSLKNLLYENNIRLKKRWGQNFLFDENILKDIVDAADLSADDLVIEVGPGAGTLTEFILKKSAEVVAVEIDRGLCEILTERFKCSEKLTVVNKNILDLDLKAFLKENNFSGFKRLNVISNLPYYITSPVIMYFLESGCHIKTMVFTIQEEVAARITAPPGNKDYGILTVIANYYSHPKIIRKIGRGAFFPAPNVDSAVVKFDVYAKPMVKVKDRELFFKVIKKSFSQRRKILRNNLLKLDIPGFSAKRLDEALSACVIDPSRRAETLSLAEFANISNLITEHRGEVLEEI